MKIMKRIATLFLMGSILICGTDFGVFAAAEEPTREIDDEYKTCYEQDVHMNIKEEEYYFEVYSDGRTIRWEAQKVDDAVYAANNCYIRKESPNANSTDEQLIPKGTEMHRIGLSPNGWDLVEIDREIYFIWYSCLTEEQPMEGNYVGTFELTAYCATGNPCADGVYPSVGYTVACNDSRLWHHWVNIEGYGMYYVHDTGGMSNNVIDIFMGSYDECIQFGRRSANVYIVD